MRGVDVAGKEISVEQRDGDHALQFETFELARMDHAGSDQPDGGTGDQVEPVACGQSPFAAGSTALVAATGAGLNPVNGP